MGASAGRGVDGRQVHSRQRRAHHQRREGRRPARRSDLTLPGLAPAIEARGLRRALLGTPTPGILAGVPGSIVLIALCASTAVLTLVSWVVFRPFERVARERGLIDQTTGS
jgi:hypothetical protein